MKKGFVKVAFAILLIVCLFGCNKTPEIIFPEETPTDVSSVPEIKYEINPLTGELNVLPENAGKRPVAVMVNNISHAQSVQAGLGDADIIFESLAEGGITRLMAVFYDVSKAGQIGTVRSARYTYAQLALP